MTEARPPIPRPEHPRPDARREPWINLNGEWEFAFDPRNIGEQRRWYRSSSIDQPFNLKIVVPYPWESKLSGVSAPEYRGAGWYRREVEIPREWLEQGLHPVLRFGAVDWNAKVWVNGWFAAEHDGGYSPFEVDLAPVLQRRAAASWCENTGPLRAVITVRAWDVCAADTPLGKQTENWYTPSSGIWQTVWLEGRSSSYVHHVHFSPDLSGGRCYALACVEVKEPGEYTVVLRSIDDSFETVRVTQTLPVGLSEVSATIPIPDAKLWSPDDPHLYDAVVELSRDGGVLDCLHSYFGMREIARGRWGGSEHEFVLLNGEPIYLLGVLDQALHPDALHSYPDDDSIRADVEAAKEFGFNLLRCHIKLNDPRYYYWADRLGMLVMSDIPSPSMYTARSRANWELTLRDAVERDFNHPSILAWILFNETWGLEEHQTDAGWAWVKQMYLLCRGLDPTRLVEDNSACSYDHVATDLNSWHFYINDYSQVRRHMQHIVAGSIPGSSLHYVGGEYVQGDEPLLNSEYGGIGARDGDLDIAYCMKFLTAELRRHERVVGYVYTELADIEWEHNGLLNYDRTAKEFGYDEFAPGMTPASIHSENFIGFDAPPCQTLSPGERAAFPLFFSQFSRQELPTLTARWTGIFCNTLAQTVVLSGSHPFQPRHYGVVSAGVVELTLPAEAGLLTLAVEAVGPGGEVIARHYVNVEVHDPHLPAQEQRPEEWVLRWSPGDFATSDWAHHTVSREGYKFSARSCGAVEYEVLAPEGLDLGRVSGARLLLEAGARTSAQRIDWQQKLGRVNYPQTDQRRKFPGDLHVEINGVSLPPVRLPDDPADARGVLSHHARIDPGSYGYLLDLPVEGEALQAVLERARSGLFTVRLSVPRHADYVGGLSLYGRRVGAYPIDPCLVLR